MKTTTASTRAIAAEIVIIVVALLGGAGWFGVRTIKESVKEIKQEDAAKKADIAAAKAQGASEAALAERARADAALLEAKNAREAERVKQIEMGRTIQRSTIEGSVAVDQLPPSKQREHLLQRIGEIDTASIALYGAPLPTDAAGWKQRALDALAGQAAAQAELDSQKAEIAHLKGQLVEAQTTRTNAEQRADQANKKAGDAQQQAHSAIVKARVESGKTLAALMQSDAASSLAHGFMWVVFAVAGFWVLGLVLKTLAIGLPADGALSNALHTAANTFHAFLAPMSVLAETQARHETGSLVESTGSFLSDLRREFPDVAAKVTPLMDVALSPTHQRKVRAAYLSVEKKIAAAAAETKALTVANS